MPLRSFSNRRTISSTTTLPASNVSFRTSKRRIKRKAGVVAKPITQSWSRTTATETRSFSKYKLYHIKEESKMKLKIMPSGGFRVWISVLNASGMWHETSPL